MEDVNFEEVQDPSSKNETPVQETKPDPYINFDQGDGNVITVTFKKEGMRALAQFLYKVLISNDIETTITETKPSTDENS